MAFITGSNCSRQAFARSPRLELGEGLQEIMAFRMVLSLRMRLETSSRYTCATSSRRTVFLLGEMSSRFLTSSMDVLSLGSMRRTMFQWSWFLMTSPSFCPFMAVETCSAAFAMVRP